MSSMISSDSSVKTVVSPINKNPKSKSHIDYLEQIQRSKEEKEIVWDDASGNPTRKPGGLFAFVKNGICAEFYMVVKISDAKDRIESWSDNVGQGDRNVLTLSPMLYSMNWQEWMQIGCPKKIQGTTRIVSAHEDLVDYIYNKIGNVEFCEETGEIIFI